MVFYSRESSNYSKQFDGYKANQLKYVASVNVNTQLTSRERCASENIGIVYDVYDWHVHHVCSNMSQYINHIAQRTWHLVHNYIQQARFVCLIICIFLRITVKSINKLEFSVEKFILVRNWPTKLFWTPQNSPPKSARISAIVFCNSCC